MTSLAKMRQSSTEDNTYAESKGKMDEYLHHMDRHNSPKIRRKQEANSKDQGMKVPDKLERLKDENLNLKRHQQELENDVKIISTQLRRMVEQLKSDKIIVGKAAHFERQLDELIEQQVQLKDQEMQLVKKVRAAQKNDRGRENKGKTMQAAFNSSPSPKKMKRAGSATMSSVERRGANGLTEH